MIHPLDYHKQYRYIGTAGREEAKSRTLKCLPKNSDHKILTKGNKEFAAELKEEDNSQCSCSSNVKWFLISGQFYSK